MSLFNGLHATPGPFLIHAALSPQSGAQIPGCPSIRRSTALKPLARRKPLGAPRHGNRHRKGRTSIGMKLTPPSLFGKKLSTRRPIKKCSRRRKAGAARKSPTGARPSITPTRSRTSPTWSNPNSPPLSTQRLDRRIPDSREARKPIPSVRVTWATRGRPRPWRADFRPTPAGVGALDTADQGGPARPGAFRAGFVRFQAVAAAFPGGRLGRGGTGDRTSRSVPSTWSRGGSRRGHCSSGGGLVISRL